MRCLIVAIVGWMATAAPAAASGGLWCTAEDANLRFEVETGMSHGAGGSFFNFRASLAFLIAGVPDDLRKVTLDDALIHSWVDEDEVRLKFHAERPPEDSASVDLVVETLGGEDGLYGGTYRVVYEVRASERREPMVWSSEGRVMCETE